MCDDKSSKPFFTKKDGIEAAGGCLHECCDSDLCNDGESSSMAGQHLPVVGMRSFDHVESLTTGMLLRPISQCNALPTELSKPHESGCVWVRPLFWPFGSHVTLIAQLYWLPSSDQFSTIGYTRFTCIIHRGLQGKLKGLARTVSFLTGYKVLSILNQLTSWLYFHFKVAFVLKDCGVRQSRSRTANSFSRLHNDNFIS